MTKNEKVIDMKKYKYKLVVGILCFVIGIGINILWEEIQVDVEKKMTKEEVNVVSQIESEFVCDDPPIVYEKGIYSNYDYAYSVIIPEEYTGYRSGCPNPNHGFGIDLDSVSQDHIYVDASYNASFWESFDDAINSSLRYLKDDQQITNVKLFQKKEVKLGNLPAVNFVIHYQKSGIPMVTEILLAFRKENSDSDIVYTLGLISTKSQYTHNRPILNKLLFSWKLQPLP
ncbi:MAG: hypothetical protein WAQ98_20520 [Blastocatellia bacterium]